MIAFELGHAAEEALADVLGMAGAKVEREVRVELDAGRGVKVSGRADFLIEIPDLINTVVELKTTNSRAMSAMVARREFGRSSHRHQLNLYLHAARLGRLPAFSGDAESGLLAYVVKDSVKGEPSSVAWDVEYDERTAIEDLATLAVVGEAAAEGMLPKRPIATPNWECNYCPYRTTCWKD